MSDAARSAHLIDTTELATRAHSVVLDVRYLAEQDIPDRDAYRAGHIPGAIFVDVDDDLAGTSTGRNGKRPLPDPADFEKTVRRWGIDAGTDVVVYGAARSAAPARAWWLLRWAGIASVRLLDGGFDAWAGEVATGESTGSVAESDFAIQPGKLPVVEIDDVPSLAERGLLFDARPAAKFSHPSDSGAGHIPGARSAPVVDFFDAAGYLLPDDVLQAKTKALGILPDTEPAAYCGSGVAASMEVFVLSILGVRARLYVGSASEWTADPSRRLAR